MTPFDAYEHRLGGYHLLESGMRMAVTPHRCPTTALDTPSDFHRITAKAEWRVVGGAWITLGQLEVDGAPVKVPSTPFVASGQFMITTYAQACHIPPPPPCTDTVCPTYPGGDPLGGLSCGPPQVVTTRSYTVVMFPTGSRCTFGYARTSFDLEGGGLTDFASTKVTDVRTWLETGGVPVFHANGFAAEPPVPQVGQRPKTKAIEVGERARFGVFTFEPCMTGSSAEGGCDVPGAAAPSAWATPSSNLVRFPRIVGTNSANGLTWAYSCKYDGPDIVR
ncbi:MAG: hypothetical protein KF773_01480 [Deltaproteobacteria bacterium]|nr:hypothetical protein [Deltaproteobacteria bacterium]